MPSDPNQRFQYSINRWLGRTAQSRATNVGSDSPAILATDVGLTRTENQDRVAALRISPRSSGGKPLLAVVVADGMGGMRDGAQCATIATSAFFYGLMLYRNLELPDRLTSSVLFADRAVFGFAAGNGGATLSVFAVDHRLTPFIANVGDSRIYGVDAERQIARLTVDDSLEEAVGGHGRDLLQFVGMGEQMRPHVSRLALGLRQLLITSDGVHYVPQSVLNSVISNSPELRVTSDRLLALARWCGSPDNASLAAVNLEKLSSTLFGDDSAEGVDLWDPSGHLSLLWLDRDDREEARPSPPVASPAEESTVRRRKPSSKSTKEKRKKDEISQAQFEIEIETPAASSASDDHSE